MGAEWIPFVFALVLAAAAGTGWWARGRVDAEEDRAEGAERKLLESQLAAAQEEISLLRQSAARTRKAQKVLQEARDRLHAASKRLEPADLQRLLREDPAYRSGGPTAHEAGGAPEPDPAGASGVEVS